MPMQRTGPLTDAERDVLGRLATGQSRDDIASDRFSSKTMVTMYLSAARDKMGAASGLEAVARFAKAQLLEELIKEERASLIKNPLDETEEHVNNITQDTIRRYQNRIKELLP